MAHTDYPSMITTNGRTPRQRPRMIKQRSIHIFTSSNGTRVLKTHRVQVYNQHWVDTFTDLRIGKCVTHRSCTSERVLESRVLGLVPIAGFEFCSLSFAPKVQQLRYPQSQGHIPPMNAPRSTQLWPGIKYCPHVSNPSGAVSDLQ